ncbi:hypothetical protein [Clostridium chromiireducens]|uniref:Uncharacterized protein n=1 Tax=Clostridium chromiireducens TaxID=225345 RepID=A0A1V4IFD2_9CLOT|nr:hypothetical protein [Clostridium chromiireducens]OPJ58663.1 hypothetical protein CLCHR_37820 [Clostridium chromiireducens]
MGTIFRGLEVVDRLKRDVREEELKDFKDMLNDEMKELNKELAVKEK